MNRMRVRLWLLVMLVLLAGPGLVHARPGAEERAASRAAEPSVLGQAWDWLISLYGGMASFIDPNGGHDVVAPGGNSLNAGGATDPLAAAR